MNTEETKSSTGLDLVAPDDPELTEIKQEESEITDEVLADAKRLADFLLEEDEGYGVAANQVALDRRVFILRNQKDRDAEPVVCINPKITKTYGPKQKYYQFKQRKDREALKLGEGCLSFPGKFTKIKRFERIAVEYINGSGEKVTEKLRGFRAVAFQHELDHLDGIICVNHPDRWSEPVLIPGHRVRYKTGK